MASRKSSTRSGQPIHQRDFTSVLLKNGMPSAWTAKARGVTMSLSSGYGGRQMGRGVSQSLRHGIRGSHFDRFLSKFYNSGRPHSSLNRQTPDQVYFNRPLLAAARN